MHDGEAKVLAISMHKPFCIAIGAGLKVAAVVATWLR